MKQSEKCSLFSMQKLSLAFKNEERSRKTVGNTLRVPWDVPDMKRTII